MQTRIAPFAVFAALLLAPWDAPAPIRVAPEGPAPREARRDVIGAVTIDDVTVTAEQGSASVAVRVRALTPGGYDVVDFGDATLHVFVDGEPVPPEDLTIAAASGREAGFVLGFRAQADGATHEIRVEIAGQAAVKTAVYPGTGSPLWPWIGGAVVVAGLLCVFLLLRRRRPALRLAFLSGPEAGDFVLLRRGTTRIGSLAENDVVLDSTRVSRYHAQITVQGGKAEIRDLHSSNGTYVNGNRIDQAFLNPGDKIRIGDVDLFFDC